MPVKNVIGVLESDECRGEWMHGTPADAKPVWHIIGGANTDHATLCGLEACDREIGTYGLVPAKRGTKITCSQCWNEYQHVKRMRFKPDDFAT